MQTFVGFQAQLHNSQFPPPDVAERYEQLAPGAFDRILKMAEQKQAAESARKDKVLAASTSDTKRANWMGFLVTIGALVGGFYLIETGHSVAGVTIILGYGVTAALSIFLRQPVGFFRSRQPPEAPPPSPQ